MIIKTKFVDLYFTENDLGYIDDLVLYINNNINIITDFFNITDIDNSDKIILNLNSNYDKFKIENNFDNDYIVAFFARRNGINKIEALNLYEQNKSNAHKNDGLLELKKRLMHEIVHAFHRIYAKLSMRWLAEGLAQVLTNQFEYEDMCLSHSLDEIVKNEKLNNGDFYKDYYVLVNYLFNNYKKEQVLEIIKKYDLQENVLITIYGNIENKRKSI